MIQHTLAHTMAALILHSPELEGEKNGKIKTNDYSSSFLEHFTSIVICFELWDIMCSLTILSFQNGNICILFSSFLHIWRQISKKFAILFGVSNTKY